MKDEKVLENEIMTDEELEKVSGGSIEDTAYDSRFLYERGLMDDWYSENATTFYWSDCSSSVDEGWRQAGITCVTCRSDDNRYYRNGQQISRDEAWKFVAERFQKIRDCEPILTPNDF